MRKYVLAVVFVLSFLVTTGSSTAQSPDDGHREIRPDNETGYWLPLLLVADHRYSVLPSFRERASVQDATATTSLQDATPPNIQVSHSGSVTGASQPITDFSEVMVSLDPTDPQHLLGTAKFFFDSPNYGFYSGVFESYDAGLTWTQLQPAGVENYDLTSDPVTTFDDQGNGYFSLLTRGPTGVDLLKKPVSGNWELPVIVDRTTIADKQWVAGDQDPQGISPYAGNLYTSWMDLRTSRMVFARSTDSNQTWSAPLPIASGDVQASVPGVAPDGTVYVVYGRHIYYGPVSGAIESVKSADGGASFTTSSVIANITSIPFTFPNSTFRTTASFPAFAVSPVDGNLYVAWPDYRHGDADIYFTRSTDDGATWDTPVRLNDDPLQSGVDQFQPQVSVAPNGRVAVMWFDRRLPCPDLPWIPTDHVGRTNYCIDTYMTRSYDEGQTWLPNFRVSAQTWDWTLNLPLTFDGDGFIGDYQGIASNDGYDFPFWNATADLGENPQNYQQAFVARVPVPYTNLALVKSAAPEIVLPGDLLTYTLVVENVGPDDAVAIRLADTLPVSTTYVSDSLVYPPGAGDGRYDAADDAITWTGALSIGVPLTLTFRVRVGHFAADAVIANTVVITDDSGAGYQRTVTTTVHVPPFIVTAAPAKGAMGVPLTAPVVITFSEPIAPGTFDYTVTPDPGGWTVNWSGQNTVATLDHADWDYGQTYHVIIGARDLDDLSLVSGPVPNPWSFTSLGPPPQIVQTSPPDGAAGAWVSAPLVITFSEPMNPDTLLYTVTPDPGGWSVAWSSGNTIATLSHTPGTYLQTYSVAITARDLDDLPLAPGPVPNPWSFTTGRGIYLPLVMRSYP